MQADESYQAVFERLGQDEYDLTDLVKCLGDFDPVDLNRNFAESSDSLDNCFIASADYQDDTPIVKVKGNLKLKVAPYSFLTPRELVSKSRDGASLNKSTRNSHCSNFSNHRCSFPMC